MAYGIALVMFELKVEGLCLSTVHGEYYGDAVADDIWRELRWRKILSGTFHGSLPNCTYEIPREKIRRH